jgi:hypothetical protein
MSKAFKSFFVTLMLMMALNFSFCQNHHTIELWLDPGTRRLHDPGTIEVNRNDDVTWKIRAGEDIRQFKIVGVQHPFNNLPNYYATSLRRTVLANAPYSDWKYIIFYQIESTSKIDHLDPKIAIRPRKNFENLIILTALIATSIASIVFFTMWRNAIAKLKKYELKNTESVYK